VVSAGQRAPVARAQAQWARWRVFVTRAPVTQAWAQARHVRAQVARQPELPLLRAPAAGGLEAVAQRPGLVPEQTPAMH
jgi:hypothetical protein